MAILLRNATFWWCLSLLIGLLPLWAAPNPPGLPLIRNFSSQTTGAHGQNWSVTTGPPGWLYFANSDGLLVYDGVTWHLHRMPNGSILRSLMTAPDGTVYFGAEGDFGFFRPDQGARIEVQSLLPKLPESERQLRQVWDIYYHEGRIVFITAGKILIYHPKLDVFKVVHDSHQFHTSFQVGGRLYVRRFNAGLACLVGDGLQPVPSGDFFADKRLHGLLPFGDALLAVTLTHGCFLYRPDHPDPAKQVQALAGPVNDFLKENQAYRALFVDEDRLAIATLLNGLILVDRDMNLLLHLNKDAGLVDNSVFDLHLDPFQHLWVTGNNGISMVGLNEPPRFFPPDHGYQSSPQVVTLHRDRLYVATFRGVYYRDWRPEANALAPFRAVTDYPDSAWCIAHDRDSLLVGGKSHVRRIVADRSEDLFQTDAPIFAIEPVVGRDDVMLLGARNGLHIMQRDGDTWRYLHKLEGFEHSVEYIVTDSDGNYWLSYTGQGMWRITLRADLRGPAVVEAFDQRNGLPTDLGNRPFVIDGKVLVATQAGVYRRRDAGSVFEPDVSLNQRLPQPLPVVLHLAEDRAGNLWLQTKRQSSQDAGPLHQVGFLSAAERADDTPINAVSLVADQRLTALMPLADGSVFFIDNDQLTSYAAGLSTADHEPPFRAFVTAIRDPRDDRVMLTPSLDRLPPAHSFGASQNGFRFNFTQNYLAYPELMEYQYYLEGYDRDWLRWSQTPTRDYTNMPPGRYRFHLRARNHRGRISEPTVLAFSIKPRLWQMTGFRLALVTFLFVALWFGQRLANRWWIRRTEALERLVAARTEALRKAQAEITESARLAGMADMAVSVLHNVGNTLNSVVISTTLIKQTVTESKLAGLTKANHVLAEVLAEEGETPLPEDQITRRRMLMSYYEKLESLFHKERDQSLDHLARLDELVRVLRDIVASQEALVQNESLREEIDLTAVVEQILVIESAELLRHNITLTRRLNPLPAASLEKWKILHVLTALFQNAIDAMASVPPTRRKLRVETFQNETEIGVKISDSGEGFTAEAREKLFQAGYTTKEGRTGFDLHHCANFIRQMGGNLTLESEGEGKGAVATVSLNKE